MLATVPGAVPFDKDFKATHGTGSLPFEQSSVGVWFSLRAQIVATAVCCRPFLKD